MNEISSTTPRTASKGKSRVGVWVLVAVLVVAGLGWWRITSSPDYQHRQVRLRLDHHFSTALMGIPSGSDSVNAMTKVERGRYEVIRAIHAALGNALYYRGNSVREKLVAIADRLDTNGGADLRTFEGCAQYLVLFDEAAPAFREYAWVTNLYQAESEGMVPPLPKLPPR